MTNALTVPAATTSARNPVRSPTPKVRPAHELGHRRDAGERDHPRATGAAIARLTGQI